MYFSSFIRVFHSTSNSYICIQYSTSTMYVSNIVRIGSLALALPPVGDIGIVRKGFLLDKRCNVFLVQRQGQVPDTRRRQRHAPRFQQPKDGPLPHGVALEPIQGGRQTHVNDLAVRRPVDGHDVGGDYRYLVGGRQRQRTHLDALLVGSGPPLEPVTAVRVVGIDRVAEFLHHQIRIGGHDIESFLRLLDVLGGDRTDHRATEHVVSVVVFLGLFVIGAIVEFFGQSEGVKLGGGSVEFHEIHPMLFGTTATSRSSRWRWWSNGKQSSRCRIIIGTTDTSTSSARTFDGERERIYSTTDILSSVPWCKQCYQYQQQHRYRYRNRRKNCTSSHDNK
mmetsp:Transcript_23143/g.50562  ORF Transcript_23143/g.50562 Transcript_23143/m.50562 type:complete len:336 (+) Transcript_23143:250-1257(+)